MATSSHLYLCAMSKFPLFCKDTPPSRTQGLPKWPIFINYIYNNIFPNTVTLWGAGRGIRILTRVIWGQIQSLGLLERAKLSHSTTCAHLKWQNAHHRRELQQMELILQDPSMDPMQPLCAGQKLSHFFSFLSGVVGDRPKALGYARETLSLNYIYNPSSFFFYI